MENTLILGLRTAIYPAPDLVHSHGDTSWRRAG
jgi:hypothetical protein